MIVNDYENIEDLIQEHCWVVKPDYTQLKEF